MQYWEYDGSHGWVVLDRVRSDHLCPRCGDPLYRAPRRFIDRLFSSGSHRFQCHFQACDWVGNLPIEDTQPAHYRDGRPTWDSLKLALQTALSRSRKLP